MSFEFPFVYADVEVYGRLFYPIVQIELKTIVGWRLFEFLVDTGADLTTVPLHILPALGINKKSLKQTKTLGVGGVSVNTWEFILPVKIGNMEFSAHASAVSSSDNSLPLLLGRKDILEERCNLLVDSKRKMTVITFNHHKTLSVISFIFSKLLNLKRFVNNISASLI